jgi:hypothetical protein
MAAASAMSREEYILRWLSSKASEGLKNLLETKHLYQKVDFDPKEILQKFLSNLKDGRGIEQFIRWQKEELANERFALSQQQIYGVDRIGIQTPIFVLLVPHISIFCKKCDRREAFAPLWYSDWTNEFEKQAKALPPKNFALPANFQMFVLVYQCQRCLGTPESFLVRCAGWSLSLEGRSPIEFVELPSQLPKTELKYYRDAVIAFNSRKVLAALFYLRTFIEQFGRRVTRSSGKITGDKIFDAYAEMLPGALKDQMPSLREWYDKLSEALHEANEDETLFGNAKAQIEIHFDIRRVFKIPEPKPAAEKDEQRKAALEAADHR